MHVVMVLKAIIYQYIEVVYMHTYSHINMRIHTYIHMYVCKYYTRWLLFAS